MHGLLKRSPAKLFLGKGVLKQIYRREPMSKYDFNKVASSFIEIALRHG